MITPPIHLSVAAQAYLREPDVLDYPVDWTDSWSVQAFRDVADPLWATMNEALDFDYTVSEDVIAGVAVQRISVAGISAGAAAASRAIVHFHGGMYCVGTPEIDHALNAPLAKAAGVEVISVDYRLAPEHPFPAAVDDALAVHNELARQGIRTAMYGESAGGGLAAACTIALRDLGQTLPTRLALISAMLDLTGSSDTYRTLAAADPDYGDTSILLDPALAYAAGSPLDHSLLSPVMADLSGLPPTLLQVGSREVLLGDSARFARAAREAGVSAELQVLDGGWHNYPIWHGVPEADAAVAALAAFLVGGFA